MNWIKKRKWDLLFLLLIGLLFIPSVRKPVQVFVQRIIATSPDELAESEKVEVNSYDWELLSMKGEVVNFSESIGRPVVLNLWATWCPPCIAEMPALQNLYDSFGIEVDFYFVSSEDSDKLKKWLKSKEYNLPVYNAYSAYPKEFESNTLPTTFVLNKQGRIVMKEVGSAKWDSDGVKDFLQELIDEKQAN
ncbi:MAG: thiol-disulfide oxidoreductase [Fluviicola sp.]|nr:MAG: thiol-disulfide oxidoreductase [Fluviicola sp.]